jgi:hypothetical protein
MGKGRPFVERREKYHGLNLSDTVNDFPVQNDGAFAAVEGTQVVQEFP